MSLMRMISRIFNPSMTRRAREALAKNKEVESAVWERIGHSLHAGPEKRAAVLKSNERAERAERLRTGERDLMDGMFGGRR